MLNFSLQKTSSRDLKSGDVFIMMASNRVYSVFHLSEKFAHGIEAVTERTVRLPRDIDTAPVFVSVALPCYFASRFDGNRDEASFLMQKAG
ncbi:MAG TPA: hypothetical protein VIL78_00735 [Hanamia sp.]